MENLISIGIWIAVGSIFAGMCWLFTLCPNLAVRIGKAEGCNQTNDQARSIMQRKWQGKVNKLTFQFLGFILLAGLELLLILKFVPQGFKDVAYFPSVIFALYIILLTGGYIKGRLQRSSRRTYAH